MIDLHDQSVQSLQELSALGMNSRDRSLGSGRDDVVVDLFWNFLMTPRNCSNFGEVVAGAIAPIDLETGCGDGVGDSANELPSVVIVLCLGGD